MKFDPLWKIKSSYAKGILSNNIYNLIINKFHLVHDCINHIYDVTNLKFPVCYVEPFLMISTSSIDIGKYGLIFARTIPTVYKNELVIIIQLSAPLIAFGSNCSIKCILVHEFLHYVNLVDKILTMNIVSDTLSSSIYENSYSDLIKIYNPAKIFRNDSSLVKYTSMNHLERLKDSALEKKSVQEWLNLKLPTKNISMDTNNTKIPIKLISKFEPDYVLKNILLSLRK